MAELSISNHAKERYAERIMDRDSKQKVAQYVAENDEKIKQNINKMVEYGEKIYSGKSLKHDNNDCDVYLKDLWVILVDSKKNTVITLYCIDLGVDEEFHKLFVEKLLKKLNDAKEECEATKADINQKIAEMREVIADNEKIIQENRSLIKTLEEQNQAHMDLIKSYTANLEMADQKVREVLASLVSVKVF